MQLTKRWSFWQISPLDILMPFFSLGYRLLVYERILDLILPIFSKTVTITTNRNKPSYVHEINSQKQLNEYNL